MCYYVYFLPHDVKCLFLAKLIVSRLYLGTESTDIRGFDNMFNYFFEVRPNTVCETVKMLNICQA